MLMFASDDFVSYEEAFKKFEKSRRPVIIIVTDAGCRHCGSMKNTLLEVKKDYEEFILCEMSFAKAKKQFEHLNLKNTVPQTFAYVYDNDDNITKRLPIIVGSTDKNTVYKTWGMK
jgi:glutaredoxin